MRKRLKKRTFVFSIGFLLCLLFLFSLEMMTSYERQLENERYKAGLDARIYSEILIKDLMVSQNVYVCHRLDPRRRREADVS